MNFSRQPRLAILGGQGALASAEFHRRLVLRWAALPGVELDDDYPEVLHWSAALSGLSLNGVENLTAAQAELARRLAFLAPWEAHLVVMPCNSLHPLVQRLQPDSPCPLLCPWNVAQAYLNSRPGPHLVLGSHSLREHIRRQGLALDLPSPAEARAVDDVIEAVVTGDLEEAGMLLSQLIDRAASNRAKSTHVVLACTELSCVYAASGAGQSVKVTDTMDLLVSAVVENLNSHVIA